MTNAQSSSTNAGTATRLAARIREARERTGLPLEEVAALGGMTAVELRTAEEEGRISTYRLERIAEATHQSIEFFLAAADDEPVSALLRAEDGSGTRTREAIDWFEQFIQRYEFVASLGR